MSKIDPVRESERLAALYARMSDGELEKVARDPQALTEWAHDALDAELKKRGLPLLRVETGEESGSDGRGEGSRPVVLRRYLDMPRALVDKSTLDSAGIESLLYDDNVVRMDWLISNAIGGVKLVVAEEDAEEAEKILVEARREIPEAAEEDS